MRRSRAIKQLAVFLIVLILYILWCAHPFFIGPSLRFSETLPPDAERMIRDMYAEGKMGEPVEFTADAFTHALCHPYRNTVSHYVVSLENPTCYRISRRHYGAWFVVLKNGTWQRSSILEIY